MRGEKKKDLKFGIFEFGPPKLQCREMKYRILHGFYVVYLTHISDNVICIITSNKNKVCQYSYFLHRNLIQKKIFFWYFLIDIETCRKNHNSYQ